MFGTGKVVRGIQGRLQHAGGAAEIVRRSRNRSAVKQKAATLVPRIRAVSTATPTGTTSSPTRRAGYSTTAPAERAVVNGKAVPLAEDIIHQRFLECMERGDANAAMAHFAFIACEVRERAAAAAEPRDAGAAREARELLTLRRRQLLVLLCEKGMVKEASELMNSAVGSPAFDSRDSCTIASFMYVICGCLSHGDVDRALLHFRQASERGIGLALPVCENLATNLFIKGLQGNPTEGEAWNILEYVRQRGMVHRPEVCEHALLYAMVSEDLSFALRVCQYTDEEGMVLNHVVRDALFRYVSSAIKRLPDTAVVNVADAGSATRAGTVGSAESAGGSEAWKVERTNATVEELWDLDALLQSWLDTEMDEFDDVDDEDDEHVLDEDDTDAGVEFEISVEESDEGERGAGGLEAAAYDVLDDYGGSMDTMTAGGDVRNCWDEDVVDFEDDDDEDDDDDDDDSSTAGGGGGGRGGGEKASTAGPGRASGWTEKTQGGDDGHSAAAYSSPDFAGGEFCGDLVDQMSELHPEEDIEFKLHEADFGFSDDGGFRRGGGAAGGHYHDSLSRRDVYVDLVMPCGDPQGQGGQGIVSIPVKISVQETDDDEEDE